MICQIVLSLFHSQLTTPRGNEAYYKAIIEDVRGQIKQGDVFEIFEVPPLQLTSVRALINTVPGIAGHITPEGTIKVVRFD